MHETGESYTSIVAVKPTNNDAGATPVSAEAGEPRGVPAWNLQRDAKIRAQIRATLHTRLLRVDVYKRQGPSSLDPNGAVILHEVCAWVNLSAASCTSC